MKKQRFISLGLAVAMVTTPLASSIGVEAKGFTDMPTNWAKEPMERAVDNGLLKGHNGKVNPKDNLTRAELLAILNRALGNVGKADISSFSDLDENKWYYTEFQKAVKADLVEGSNGKMYPNAPITREEAFVIVGRAFDIAEKTNSMSNFKDNKNVSSWAKDNINGLISRGYLKGSNGNINPKAYITRAEYASIMNELVPAYDKDIANLGKEIKGNLLVKSVDTILRGLKIEGDLILSEALANKKISLDGVEVKGRILVRGSGEVQLINGSKAERLVVQNPESTTKVNISKDSTIQYADLKSKTDLAGEGRVKQVYLHKGSDLSTIKTKGTKIDATEGGIKYTDETKDKPEEVVTLPPASGEDSTSGGNTETPKPEEKDTITIKPDKEGKAVVNGNYKKVILEGDFKEVTIEGKLEELGIKGKVEEIKLATESNFKLNIPGNYDGRVTLVKDEKLAKTGAIEILKGPQTITMTLDNAQKKVTITKDGFQMEDVQTEFSGVIEFEIIDKETKEKIRDFEITMRHYDEVVGEVVEDYAVSEEGNIFYMAKGFYQYEIKAQGYQGTGLTGQFEVKEIESLKRTIELEKLPEIEPYMDFQQAVINLMKLENITLENKEAIENARELYNELSDEQKNKVEEQYIDKLEALELEIKELEEIPVTPLEPALNVLKVANTFEITDVKDLRFMVKSITQPGSKEGTRVQKLATLEEVNTHFNNNYEVKNGYKLEAELVGNDLVLRTYMTEELFTEIKEKDGAVADTPYRLTVLKGENKKEDKILKLAYGKDQVNFIYVSVENVEKLIAKLPEVGEVKLEDKVKVEEARVVLDSLTEEKQALVKVELVEKLEALELKLENLASAESDKELAKKVEDLINNLPKIEEVKVEDKEAVKEARVAYEALTEEQKALLNADLVEKLVALENKIVALEKANEEAKKEAEESLKEVLAKAKEYKYDPVYNYNHSKIEIVEDTVNVEYKDIAVENSKVVMNDLARYLGAMYRIDEGETVKAIEYKDKKYTWEGNLKGSNWKNGSKTLIKEITNDFIANKELRELDLKLIGDFELVRDIKLVGKLVAPVTPLEPALKVVTVKNTFGVTDIKNIRFMVKSITNDKGGQKVARLEEVNDHFNSNYGVKDGYKLEVELVEGNLVLKTYMTEELFAEIKGKDGADSTTPYRITVLKGENKKEDKIIKLAYTKDDVELEEITIAKVENEDQLKNAIENEAVKTIELIKDIEVTNKIDILTEKTIDGKGFSITGNDTEGWNSLYLLHFYNTKGLVKNLTLTNGDAGILVNGSELTVEDVNISDMEFGGIEVSKGKGLTKNPKLTINSNNFSLNKNLPAIWIDGYRDLGRDVVEYTGSGAFKESHIIKVGETEKDQLWFTNEVVADDSIVKFQETLTLENENIIADNIRFKVKDLNKDGTNVQKASTLVEVKDFMIDKDIEFDSSAIKIEDGKIEISKRILKPSDWKKIKENGDKTIPYRITVLLNDNKANKLGKIAMYEDGLVKIEDSKLELKKQVDGYLVDVKDAEKLIKDYEKLDDSLKNEETGKVVKELNEKLEKINTEVEEFMAEVDEAIATKDEQKAKELLNKYSNKLRYDSKEVICEDADMLGKLLELPKIKSATEEITE